ncbi:MULTISPECIES: LysR substrate-binding domain-containing protein [Rhizobium]|uniref:LysR substrate-binding domain-containing protein n=1 Tax=Rhizobium TaxID=379 RepID=UPI001B341BC1|nr:MULTISPECIES: LysR substrate-binding domain-containing protein [Rhizobium]MBX4908300.1 LysR family transcriptional regulator [Rhizobium bangladeshense]MBX5217185.1 LysR family transcriptional regulator [Rhizobium sp. NLR9a]MBX5233516.1 LysR family transcriptional regulator [Rhizobium sp. NLR4a]MBX5245559.1 LysR family transcriptional regulator [Rhizobium sp. NLR3b]MBX5251155.1 LysR family transcriptional regulator [Rhizobium sp. NLR4b]
MKNLNSVHLNGLRALEAVGRLGSLQAAADELGVSVGAVSQQVIKAEAQLGQVIFERTARGMIATEAARPVLTALDEGFARLSAAVSIASRKDDTILTISVAPVFAARWLVHRLHRFAKGYPDIKLRLDATTNLVNPAISDVDIGIRVGAGKWPDVKAELLLEQEVFPVCSPEMAANLKQPADILALPAIIDGPAMFSWEVWMSEAGLSGATLATRHVFNDASLCLDAAIAGQGVMLAWQTLAAFALAEGRLAAPFGIRAKTGFGHYFVTAEGTREPKKVKDFKAWIREEMAGTLALFR